MQNALWQNSKAEPHVMKGTWDESKEQIQMFYKTQTIIKQQGLEEHHTFLKPNIYYFH